MRNKGQSQIITTILLILIVLAAVIVVWMIIDRFIDVPTADCTEVRMSIERINTSSGEVFIKRLAGGSNVDVSGAIVGCGDEVKTIDVLNELQTKSVTFESIDSGEVVEVAATITNPEGDDFTCQASDKRTVS